MQAKPVVGGGSHVVGRCPAALGGAKVGLWVIGLGKAMPKEGVRTKAAQEAPGWTRR